MGSVGVWDRTDLTVFVSGWVSVEEYRSFLRELGEVCPKLHYRDRRPGVTSPNFDMGLELCFGWMTEPLFQYSRGGSGSYRWHKIWKPQEFLDAMPNNDR
jgi:hypothetical protein